jgi:PAS domain S-box-containing protein
MKRNSPNLIAKRKNRLALKVCLIYALLGASWILFSDKVAEILIKKAEWAVVISMTKGVAFVLFTAILLYLLIRRDMLRFLAAEEALGKSEALYRELVENANSIILRTDTGGNITFVNEYGLNFFGYSEEDLLGKNVVGSIVPEKRTTAGGASGGAIEELCVDLDRHGKSVCENVLRNGERVWIAWTSKSIGKQGQVEEFLSVGIDITERKQAADELTRVNLLLRTQQEASINGILSIDETGNIISSNQRFSGMWGVCEDLAVEGLNSRPLLKAIAEKVSGSRDFLERILGIDSELGQTGLHEIDLKDGRVFEAYSAPISGAEGSFHGHVWHFRDITERKLMERTAAEAEAKYRDIFENSVSGIYQVDLDGRVLTVNRTIADILGYDSPEEMSENINHDARQLYVRPERRNDLIRLIGERGVAREFVVEFYRKDKSAVWVCLDVRAVRGADGEIKYTEGTCRDVTAQKLMEQAVVRAEEKYRHIFENSIIGIFQVSREGHFLNMNQALAGSLGYESPEIASQEVGYVKNLFVHPERHEELLWLIKSKGLVEQFEIEFFRKDKSVIWGSLNVNTIRGPDGRVVYLDGAMQDITDRKLLRARLDQAQRMEAIGTLAGGIAHDFNNILTPIIGYAELSLISLPEESRLARNMRQVLLSANRAKDLIKRILTISRETGNEPKPVQVSLIIEEVLKLLRSSLPSTIEIRQAIEEEASDCTTMAEPTQIHQVLMNLCTNGAHAMRAKGGTLTVGLSGTEVVQLSGIDAVDIEPGFYLRLTVADTGQGMDETVQERIFDPYFTTKGPEEGTGLGLAIVYGIVKNLRGAITVSSKPGQGAAFEVYLPGNKTPEVSAALLAEPLPSGSGRVLLVDDEVPIVDMTREMLESLGYEVVARHNGADALEVFLSDPQGFDAVITDMTMPKMTGADLAGEILAIRADMPIILCTGFSDGFDEDKAKASGIGGFLMKPVAMRDLALALGDMVAGGIREPSISR